MQPMHLKAVDVSSDSLEKRSVGTLGTWRRARHRDQKKKSRSLKSLRRLEVFSSSPALNLETMDTRHQLEVAAPVLQFTSE